MTENKDAFFERSKAVIELCNQQLAQARDIEVAASAAYGAARFSLWSMGRTTLTRREFEARKAEAIASFTKGFGEMLEEQYQDLLDNYDTYFPQKPGVVTR